jgi:hypothetical protein
MASLRKAATSPEVTATYKDATVRTMGDGSTHVEFKEEAPPPPPPEPAPPLDEAAEALRKQIEALRQSEDLVHRQSALALETNKQRQAWLERTPGAKENVAILNVLHSAALAAGLVDGSPQYFAALEQQLATLPQPTNNARHMAEEMQQHAAQNGQQQPQPQPEPRPSRYVSAPVSREIPSAGNGTRAPRQVTLTADQKEAARMSGISEVEYARQLMKLNEMRAAGEYPDQR